MIESLRLDALGEVPWPRACTAGAPVTTASSTSATARARVVPGAVGRRRSAISDRIARGPSSKNVYAATWASAVRVASSSESSGRKCARRSAVRTKAPMPT